MNETFEYRVERRLLRNDPWLPYGAEVETNRYFANEFCEELRIVDPGVEYRVTSRTIVIVTDWTPL